MQTQSDVESMLLATGAAIKQEGTKRVASRFLFTIYPRHLRGAHARHRHKRYVQGRHGTCLQDKLGPQ